MKLITSVKHKAGAAATLAFVGFLAGCGGSGGNPGDAGQLANNALGVDSGAGTNGTGVSVNPLIVGPDGTLPGTSATGIGTTAPVATGTNTTGTGTAVVPNEVLPDTTGTTGSTPGDNGAVVVSGKFAFPIIGVTYLSGTTTGKTDETGAFKYEQGKSLIFKIGDVVISTVTPKKCLTPVELANGANAQFFATSDVIPTTSQVYPASLGLIRFLQFLDDPASSANDITINENHHQTMSLADTGALSPQAAEAIGGAAFEGVKGIEQAIVLIRDTAVGCLAGNYKGEHMSRIGMTGKYDITVAPDGSLSGTITESSDTVVTFSVTGTVSSNGIITFTEVIADGVPLPADLGAYKGTIDPETNTMKVTYEPRKNTEV